MSETQYPLHKHRGHASEIAALASTCATHMQMVSGVATMVDEGHGSHTTPTSCAAHGLGWNGSHSDDHIFIPCRTSWPDSYANEQPLIRSVEDKTPDVGARLLGEPNTSLSPVNPFHEHQSCTPSLSHLVAAPHGCLPQLIGPNKSHRDGECFLWPGHSSPADELHHQADTAAPSVTRPSRDEHSSRYQPFLSYNRFFIDPQHIWFTRTDIAPTYHTPMILDGSCSSACNDLQSCSWVADTPSYTSFYPSLNGLLSPMNNPMYMYPHNDSNLPSSSYAAATAPQQLQPFGATYSPSTTSRLPLQVAAPSPSMERILPICQNSLESHLIAHSSHNFDQTAPLPNQSLLRTCEWIKDDGTICGEQITWEDVPGHLATHGIMGMTRKHPTSCKWSGCQPRRGKSTMNRKNIVRHVRETHLHYRRPHRRPSSSLSSLGSGVGSRP